jgi:Fic family protein
MARQGKRPRLKDDVFNKIVAELQNKAEKPPAGFLTREEWSKRWGLKRTSTCRYLDDGVRSGILEVVLVRRDLGAYVRRVPHWGLNRKLVNKHFKRP